MPRPPWDLFGRLVRRLPVRDGDPAADADLIARFVHDRDPAAFELLVWRHGGLVLGVCRRILRDDHLAEDAFQATFLVLARKAGAVRGQNVAGWLHRVARRVAVRAAKKRAKVAAREGFLSREPAIETAVADRDWAGILDAEVGRLPDRFRLPVLLCYLQDYTTDEAARALGIPRGTVLSRLATARQKLSARLTRRDVTPPATLVSTTVASNQLVSATVRSAAAFAAGEAALTSAPTLLATEVIRMSAWKLPAAVAAAMMLTVSIGSGVARVQGGGGTGRGGVEPQQNTKPMQETAKDQPDSKKPDDELRKAAIETLNFQLSDLQKKLDRTQQEMGKLYRSMRELSLEEFSAIQQRYANRGREHSAAYRELKEIEFRLKLYEDTGKDEIKAVYEKEKASSNVVRIDPSTRDGLKLQAYYKQQVDAELKLKELTATGLDDSNLSVKVQTKLLAGLSKEIVELESRIRETNAKEKYEASERELEAKQKGDQIKKRFLQSHVDILEYQLKKDLQLGVKIGEMQNDYENLKGRASDLEVKIRELQHTRSRLDASNEPALPVGDRLDTILLELANLRKDVADLKQAAKK
jgi:RNA polymerase sigma factor (sigma-70 family)